MSIQGLTSENEISKSRTNVTACWSLHEITGYEALQPSRSFFYAALLSNTSCSPTAATGARDSCREASNKPGNVWTVTKGHISNLLTASHVDFTFGSWKKQSMNRTNPDILLLDTLTACCSWLRSRQWKQSFGASTARTDDMGFVLPTSLISPWTWHTLNLNKPGSRSVPL